MERIGFIGIGHMGWPMAANLARAGYHVSVFDTDAARVADFASQFQVEAAQVPVGLAHADIVITMLPNGQIVRDALSQGGEDSLMARMAPGAVVVDMSSSAPMGTRQLGGELARRNIGLVDAPVSGGVARAQTGELTIMYGADDPQAVQRVLPVLNVMGAKLFSVGGLGCGHAMKALNNYVASATFAATTEALDVGTKFGLSADVMVDVLNVSTGRNFHTDLVFKQHVLNGKFGVGFAIGLLAKDVRIAADLAEALNKAAPLLRLMEDRWDQARDARGATQDFSAAYLAWTEQDGS